MDYQLIIDKYYRHDTHVRDIYIRHCQQVAHKALTIAHRLNLNINDEEIVTAAMLHDIGIINTDADKIDCHGTEPYLRHGILGAELLRHEGVDEKYARVAERHTGAGLTANDIRSRELPLPQRDMLPETPLEKLICYADKFYSKSGDMQEKSLEKIRKSMTKFSPETLARFNQLHDMFNIEEAGDC